MVATHICGPNVDRRAQRERDRRGREADAAKTGARRLAPRAQNVTASAKSSIGCSAAGAEAAGAA